jgi:hypothetical protein
MKIIWNIRAISTTQKRQHVATPNTRENHPGNPHGVFVILLKQEAPISYLFMMSHWCQLTPLIPTLCVALLKALPSEYLVDRVLSALPCW